MVHQKRKDKGVQMKDEYKFDMKKLLLLANTDYEKISILTALSLGTQISDKNQANRSLMFFCILQILFDLFILFKVIA